MRDILRSNKVNLKGVKFEGANLPFCWCFAISYVEKFNHMVICTLFEANEKKKVNTCHKIDIKCNILHK